MEVVCVTRATTRLVGLVLVAILGIGLCAVVPSFAGVQGLEDEDNAKLARHKAQMKQAPKKGSTKNGASGAGSESDKCGSIDVGNVTNNKPGRPVREVTVIVDGPIINANNKCR